MPLSVRRGCLEAFIAAVCLLCSVRVLPTADAAVIYMARQETLFRFDTETSNSTRVGTIIADPSGDNQEISLNGLAVDPTDGTLWGKSSGGDYGDNAQYGHSLFKINKETAEATLITRTLRGGYMAANCKGELLLMVGPGCSGSYGHTVVSIDKTTGAVIEDKGRVETPTEDCAYGSAIAFDGKDDDVIHYFTENGNLYARTDFQTIETLAVTETPQRDVRNCDIDKDADELTFYCGDDSFSVTPAIVTFTADGIANTTNDVLIELGDDIRSYPTGLTIEWSCPNDGGCDFFLWSILGFILKVVSFGFIDICG